MIAVFQNWNYEDTLKLHLGHCSDQQDQGDPVDFPKPSSPVNLIDVLSLGELERRQVAKAFFFL